jgi:dockerin type I repeat protein
MLGKRRSKSWLRRRALRHELLESRSLLAGMVGDSPWQNPLDAEDLNCDGTVSPVDALVAINALNSGMTGDLEHQMAPPGLLGRIVGAASDFVDASGDGQLTPVDALSVINTLNQGLHLGSPSDLPTGDQQPGTPGPDAPAIDLSSGFAKIRAVINSDGDIDVFQVTPTKPELNVSLFSGGKAMSVTVVDGSNNQVGSATTDAGSDHPARTSFSVQTGTTYFLVVKADPGVTGPYGLTVLNFTDEEFTPVTDSPLGTDIHSDTQATATVLTLNHGHAEVSSNIDAAADVDMFKIDAVDGKLAVSAGSKIPLSLQITDSTGKILGSITSSDRSELALHVTAGTYFVSVAAANGTDTGPYHLSVENEPFLAQPGSDDDGPGEPIDHPDEPTPQALFMKIDTNGDSSVSLDEFKASVPFGKLPMADNVFTNWDTDHNGSLSLDEFMTGLVTLHLRSPEGSDSDDGPPSPVVTNH